MPKYLKLKIGSKRGKVPELPEVETIKREFNLTVVGKVFDRVEILDKKVIKFSRPDFNSKIKGKKVTKAQRMAKILVINTNNPNSLMIHLKMTGQLIFQSKTGQRTGGGHPDKLYYGQKLPHQYTRAILTFRDGSQLFFNDLRRFGWIKIINRQKEKIRELANLGPEPFDKNFSLFYFQNGLEKRKKSNIKALLMDQKFISGIGNIYANEALFLAKINPQKKSGQLSPPEAQKLHQAIIKILTKAVKLRGTSEDSYVDLAGRKGGYLPQALVYGREGKKCRGCPGKVKKIKIAGRGTYFCPTCQR